MNLIWSGNGKVQTGKVHDHRNNISQDNFMLLSYHVVCVVLWSRPDPDPTTQHGRIK